MVEFYKRNEIWLSENNCQTWSPKHKILFNWSLLLEYLLMTPRPWATVSIHNVLNVEKETEKNPRSYFFVFIFIRFFRSYNLLMGEEKKIDIPICT